MKLSRPKNSPIPRPNHGGCCAGHSRPWLRRLPLATAISAILTGIPLAHADSQSEAVGLDEIVVTAQKRTENLQDVPISIDVFDNQKLENLNIVDLDG